MALLVVTVTSVAVAQQRRVSPVERSTNRTMTTKELNEKKKELRAQGMVIMGDSIVADSVAMKSDTVKVTKMQYPMLTSVIVGVNFWDPLMRILGQSYGGVDFSAELSMWNRIHPIVEVGAGWANSTPEDMNFTYKGKLSLYGKLGANYNFSFNSSPDYVAMVGLRAGYSSFKYDITDISLVNDYWGQNKTIEILDQKSHALWCELMLSLKIKLVGNLSAGWAFKYHFLLNHKSNTNSEPWYIPGFGSRTGHITGGFSLYYTIPLHKKKEPVVPDMSPEGAPHRPDMHGNQAPRPIERTDSVQ